MILVGLLVFAPYVNGGWGCLGDCAVCVYGVTGSLVIALRLYHMCIYVGWHGDLCGVYAV